MATVRITQRFTEGSETVVEVEVEDSYPDCVAEAVSQTLRLWRETVQDDEAT